MKEVSAPSGPQLPDHLSDIWRHGEHSLHAMYEQLRALTLAGFRGDMEPINPPPVDRAAPYIEFCLPKNVCRDDIDQESAIIVPHPFGIGWGKGAENHYVRTRLIHASNPGKRLISFPNSMPGRPTFDFTRQERGKVIAGDFTPMSDRVFRTLSALGVSHVQAACYSQAAATGGHIMARAASSGEFDVGNSGFIDMPNNVQRSTGRLIIDFLSTGAADVNKARRHAGIGVLTESSYSTSRALYDLAGKVVQPDNWSFARGLRHDTFGKDMRQFLGNSEAEILVARAEHSTVTPKEPFDFTVKALENEFPGRVRSEEVPGYGHGLGENSALHALLISLAFDPASRPA